MKTWVLITCAGVLALGMVVATVAHGLLNRYSTVKAAGTPAVYVVDRVCGDVWFVKFGKMQPVKKLPE